MGQFSKPLNELKFSDNFIFCKVLRNKKLCKKMLEILLSIQIDKIEYIESEYPLDEYYNQRGIRLDVFVKDSDRIFDLEMQAGNYNDILMRARYYTSATDFSCTPRRTKFKSLKESYIIFICKDDPFNLELPCYTVKQSFFEAPDFSINDKTHKIFYNTSAWDKVIDKNIKAVLKYIYTDDPSTDFTIELENSVRNVKTEPSFKDDYMYFMDIVEEEKEIASNIAREEGRKAGIKEGREEGREEGTIQTYMKLINMKLAKNIPIEQIAEQIELSVEEINKIINR